MVPQNDHTDSSPLCCIESGGLRLGSSCVKAGLRHVDTIMKRGDPLVTRCLFGTNSFKAELSVNLVHVD
jgi:hypothetical protein